MFFILLTVAEHRSGGKKSPGRIPERFRLEFRDDLSPESLGVRPDKLVVGVHDPDQLSHLNAVLEHSDPSKQDVILVAVKPGDVARSGKADEPDQVDWERISENRESIQVTIQPDGEEDPTCIDLRPTEPKP